MMSEAATPRKRRSVGRLVLLLLALVFVLKIVWFGRYAYVLYTRGMRLKSLAANPTALLQPEGPAKLRADLAAVEGALHGLYSGLRFVWRSWWLPWRAGRENLTAIGALLQAGEQLAQAGQTVAEGLRPIAESMQGRSGSGAAEETASMTEALFGGLVQARAHFQRAEAQVEQATNTVAELSAAGLWSPVARGVGLLKRYLPLGRAGLGAAAAAPALLGEARPTQYLVLAQNSEELRATGGFITSIGVATFDRGKLAQLSMKDSYSYDRFTVDHPDAPQPMRRHMGMDLWTTRDGNWSPDFPTTAQDVERLYHLENTGDIRGVIAFDIFAVQQVVRAVGPLDIPEYNDRVDGENVLDKMRAFWSAPNPGEEPGHRKDFVDVMASAVMDRLQSPGQLGQMETLARMLKRLVDERHVQMYFQEPAAQGLLAAGGWDGRLVTAIAGDYLLAVDTNMGYNKVNANVEKQMEYEVTLAQEDGPTASVAITYTNHSPPQPVCDQFRKRELVYEQFANDCYWDYLRLYVPQGSQLLSTDGITETETLPDEAGRTVWGAFFVVPANASHTVRFRYRLPDWETGQYRLYVQKQAGTAAVAMVVRVVLPSGVRLASAHPQPKRVAEGVITYEWDLRQDRSLSLSLD